MSWMSGCAIRSPGRSLILCRNRTSGSRQRTPSDTAREPCGAPIELRERVLAVDGDKIGGLSGTRIDLDEQRPHRISTPSSDFVDEVQFEIAVVT
jgi:hypothetical protein